MTSGYYPDAVISSRMEEKRIEMGLSVEEAAALAGFGVWSWYKKADGSSPFSVEQAGRFAAGIRAPLGWPFIEWSAALLLQNTLAPRK